MRDMKTIEYWTVEHNAYSTMATNGESFWFSLGARYESYAKALSVVSNRRNSLSDNSINWRIGHIITTTEYIEL
jgi:hypothetical protein